MKEFQSVFKNELEEYLKINQGTVNGDMCIRDSSIQNQKIYLENYARGQRLTNIRHYIDDDESGRFFDRSAYSRMMDDVENGKIIICRGPRSKKSTICGFQAQRTLQNHE